MVRANISKKLNNLDYLGGFVACRICKHILSLQVGIYEEYKGSMGVSL